MEVACPYCGSANVVHDPAQPGPDLPFPGAFTICVYCEGIGRFVDGPFGLVIRPPTEEEWDRIQAYPAVADFLARVKEIRRRHGPQQTT